MNRRAPTLSLCMIVRDEADNLPRSLEPVASLFDQAVVVDTGSRDGTPDLAAAMGAEVYCIEWRQDFAAARNESLRRARSDWVLWLDADNHIAPEDASRLRKNLDSRRRSILWCTEVVVPQGERLIQKRVFPNRPEVRFEGRVHEQLVHPPDYASVVIPVEILHWGYEDRAAAREKGRRNLELLQRMAEENPDDFYVCYQMGRTLLNLRKFDEAAGWLDRACRLTGSGKVPDGPPAHARILLARALDRADRRDEAEEVLGGLAGLRPDYGPVHLSLGERFYRRGLLREAAEHLQKFLKLGTGDPVAGMNPDRMHFSAGMLLGRILEQTGDADGAYQAYETACRSERGNPEPLLAQARLDLAADRTGPARRRLEDCLRLSPGNRRAAALLQEAGHA